MVVVGAAAADNVVLRGDDVPSVVVDGASARYEARGPIVGDDLGGLGDGEDSTDTREHSPILERDDRTRQQTQFLNYTVMGGK